MGYFEMANKEYALNNYSKAVELYKKASISGDNEISSLYNIAVCHIKLKQYANALTFLKEAISKKADSKYYYNLGYCYSMVGDNKKALLYFNTAWSIDSKDDDCKKAVDFILDRYKKSKPNKW